MRAILEEGNQSAMGNHVFICYAREDQEFVLKLATNLKDRGVPVWLDQWDIPSGANWNRSIDTAIYECAKFLLVLSPAATESQEVEGEWLTALDEKKIIVPVLYQACRIPRQLRSIQRVDFPSRDPDDESSLTRLVGVLGTGQQTIYQSAEIPTDPQNQGSQKTAGPVQESPPQLIRNSIGMELVLIPAGEFLMGSGEYDDERPPHKVRISRPFYLGKYPVTQAQWEAVMRNNPNHFKGDPNRPVENVSWHDVQEFLRKLSKQEGGKPYRLPTEAEWEYAARAGTTTAYYFGDNESQLKEYAWYEKNAGNTTHVVGQLKPNAWGLYDMLGNVWEWCEDWYDASYYKQSPVEDPQGPVEPARGFFGKILGMIKPKVLRGGSWFNYPWLARVSNRYWTDPGDRHGSIGFRCAQ